jgi:transposase InsO family protein
VRGFFRRARRLGHFIVEPLSLGLSAEMELEASRPIRRLTEAFPSDSLPGLLIRDNDGAYGEAFTQRLRAMGIRDCPIVPRSPWKNGNVERSIRREWLDHVIIWGEVHLRDVLKANTAYYNATRVIAELTRTFQTLGQSRGAASSSLMLC